MQSPYFQKSTGAFYLLQICVIIMLTGCSPKIIAPETAEYSRSGISGQIFICSDNTELPLSVWKPPHEITGVIIALHGFNDYSKFMKDSALFFNNNQLAVYAYDQRGFGETQTRGRWSGSQALVDDLAAFAAQIKTMYPATPRYILGDSMGGAVTVLAMAGENPPDVEGIILVAPAVWARSEMPFYQRLEKVDLKKV